MEESRLAVAADDAVDGGSDGTHILRVRLRCQDYTCCVNIRRQYVAFRTSAGCSVGAGEHGINR